MSARLSIIESPDGEILIDGQPTDFCPPWKTEDAIRQQSADIAELRAELAAAVAERERIRAMYVESTERLCDDLQCLRERAEQAEARLSAIDSAPVVAVIDQGEDGPIFADLKLEFECYEKPISIGTELIAKPAKDWA